MSEQRLNPDILLQKVQKEASHEKRGKLKIYLGATPGVGKTYEMLRDGLESRARGLDVVLGVGESHQRPETQVMIDAFECIPKLPIFYRGKEFLEFNLDASLKRSPGLILIDEMAHTNVPGSRHTKRWQDIKELLDRGLDVCTTLNVQHIESLNDDVAQIIHAPIGETVPDYMIEMAENIELVDLTVEDLLIRLQEGKVYIPDQIKLAKEKYFQVGNLIALRELALRVVAQRVNAQADTYRQGQGIKQIWPITEKVLVCVGPGKEAQKLIRAAKRVASSLKIDWIAVYVEQPYMNASDARRNHAKQNLHFAEQLGAEIRILTGYNIATEVLNFAREQNVTFIMIWKPIQTRLKDLFLPSIADEVVRYSEEVDVYIMTGERQIKPKNHTISRPTINTRNLFLSVSMITLVTLLNLFLYPVLSTNSQIILYLLALSTVALRADVSILILSFMLCFILYSVLFVPPFYNLAIPDLNASLTWAGVLLITLTISRLKWLIQFQTQSGRKMEQQTAALNYLSRRLYTVYETDQVLQIGTDYIAGLFESKVWGLLPYYEDLEIRAMSKTKQNLDSKEYGIARWVFELGQPAGLGTDTLSFSKAFYMPLLGTQRVLGVLRIQPIKKEKMISYENIHFLESCAHQIAVALELSIFRENKE
jgi:two-component system, OmpR family, sensor histidine kinase KdpD